MFECELCSTTDCECDLKGLIEEDDNQYCDNCGGLLDGSEENEDLCDICFIDEEDGDF